MPKGTLKEVKIVPVNGIFKVCFTFDVEMEDVAPATTPDRIVAIDFGVDNLMAVTNNFGAECLLYKGGIVKSVNHFYNKRKELHPKMQLNSILSNLLNYSFSLP
jgi:putative transposase